MARADHSPTPDTRIRRAQLASIALLAIAFTAIAAYLLFHPEVRRSGTNSVPADIFFVTLDQEHPELCVRGGTIPPGTGGIRTLLGTFGAAGPPLQLTIADGSGTLLREARFSGYGDGARPVIAFDELPDAVKNSSICLKIASGKLGLFGSPNGNLDPTAAGFRGKSPAPGDLSIEYLRPGKHSLASMVGDVMKRASLFRPSWVGPWTFYVVFVLAFAVIALALWQLLRLSRFAELSGRRWLLLIAAVAFANAALWSIITPAFNVPDELAHYVYVDTLSRGELPDKSVAPGETGNAYLPSDVLASNYTAVHVILKPFVKPPWDAASEREFERGYARLRAGPDTAYGVTPAAGYSPAYYAPAVVPYKLAGNAGVFDKLWLLRLYSALLIALAAVFVALFAREILPSVTWFAPVAGLSAAFLPMFAHVGGGVTNDNMLILVASVLLWICACILRRGPSTRMAVAAGATFAVGFAVKPTIVGIAPALLVAAAAVLWMDRENRGINAKRLAWGAAAMVVAGALVVGIFGPGSGQAGSLAAGTGDRPATPWGALSYIWQFFLPTLPFMSEFQYGGGLPPAGQVFVAGFTGNFNHLDTKFPNWVYVGIGAVGAMLFASALIAINRSREALRTRWPLIAMPLAAVGGLVLFITLTAYLVFVHDGTSFAQGRYLLPGIAVFGTFVAAGCLGFGRRRGLVVGTTVVLALALLNVAGMALSLTRFYV
ncbi:MAG: DUF2142 domain-containing protein [Solirubrobacterales bacterium]